MSHAERCQMDICENLEDSFLQLLCRRTSQPEVDSYSPTADGQCEGCLSRIHQFDGTNQLSIQVSAEPLCAHDENP